MIKNCLRHWGSREKDATNCILRTGEASVEEVIFKSKFKHEQDFGKQRLVDKHSKQREE